MDDIPVIETEWGSNLHRKLIEEKARLRMEWRDSPAAFEDVRLLAEAPPLRWEGVIAPAQKSTGKTPIHVWTR